MKSRAIHGTKFKHRKYTNVALIQAIEMFLIHLIT